MHISSIVFVVVCLVPGIRLQVEKQEHLDYDAEVEPLPDPTPLPKFKLSLSNPAADKSGVEYEEENPEDNANAARSLKDDYTFVALIDIVFSDFCKRTCTGAIIHDNVVITAAHCFTMLRNKYTLPELSMSFVVIGTKVMFETGYEQYLPIERVVTHPRFKGWTADLALVFTFAGMITEKPGQLIPLAVDRSSAPVDSNVTVLSWGHCNDGPEDQSDEKPKGGSKKWNRDFDGAMVTKTILTSDENDEKIKRMRSKNKIIRAFVTERRKNTVKDENDSSQEKFHARARLQVRNIRSTTGKTEMPRTYTEYEDKNVDYLETPNYYMDPTFLVLKKKTNPPKLIEPKQTFTFSNTETARAKKYEAKESFLSFGSLFESEEKTQRYGDKSRPSVGAHSGNKKPRKPLEPIRRSLDIPAVKPGLQPPARVVQQLQPKLPAEVKSLEPQTSQSKSPRWPQQYYRMQEAKQSKPVTYKPKEPQPVRPQQVPRKQPYIQHLSLQPTPVNARRKIVARDIAAQSVDNMAPKPDNDKYLSMHKNWRRQLGTVQNNLTVGIFGYVNLATCKKIVERTLPPLYEINNKNEVLCYSSEEFYITNEDSGAPVVQANRLVAVTVGGVDSDGEHVAVGMKIACFCPWIAENLPSIGGPRLKCCRSCCDNRPKSKKQQEEADENLPSIRLRGHKRELGIHRFAEDADDEAEEALSPRQDKRRDARTQHDEDNSQWDKEDESDNAEDKGKTNNNKPVQRSQNLKKRTTEPLYE